MSTKITADNGAEIQVGQLGITVDHPEGIASIWARLTPERRAELAAALAPAPAPTHPINPADCPPDHVYMGTVNGKREVMCRFPGRELPWETFANVHADDSVSDLVPLVEAHIADGWVRRAGQWMGRAQKAKRERDEAASRATLAEQECENWRVTAINRAAPAVSRADVERAIGSRPVVRRFLDDVTMVSVSDAADAVCDLLGVEAEQAVDPAEEMADNLADILYGDEFVTEQMRGVLERVVRAGMLFPSEATSDE